MELVEDALPGNSAKIRALLDLIEARPARVLDVGCGDLSLWAALRERPHVVGVDIALPPPRVEGIERIEASALELPFGAEFFDAVVSTQLLDDLDDRAHALREMRRVLRASGRLFLTCDSANARRPLRARVRRVPRGPTLDELRREAIDAGFEIEVLRRYGLRDLKAAQAGADGRARRLTLDVEEALEPDDEKLWGLLYLRARRGDDRRAE